MKKSLLKRRTPLNRGGRLRPVSKAKARTKRKYAKKRIPFLQKHPWCWWSLVIHGQLVPSDTIHHAYGRVGELEHDETLFIPVSSSVHPKEIHIESVNVARAAGFIIENGTQLDFARNLVRIIERGARKWAWLKGDKSYGLPPEIVAPAAPPGV